MVVSDGTPETWLTLDFMFTADISNSYKLRGLNANIDKKWEAVAENIRHHTLKADIVALDLRPLNALNRARVIAYGTIAGRTT